MTTNFATNLHVAALIKCYCFQKRTVLKLANELYPDKQIQSTLVTVNPYSLPRLKFGTTQKRLLVL